MPENPETVEMPASDFEPDPIRHPQTFRANATAIAALLIGEGLSEA